MLPRVSIYNMQNMVTGMTFHQTEDTFQCGSHFRWCRENPHRSPWTCHGRGCTPHCWKAKACNITLTWCGTGGSQMLKKQTEVCSSSEKSASMKGHTGSVYISSTVGANLESYTVGFEEPVPTLYMFYIWSFLQTGCSLVPCIEGPWASQSAWDRPGAPSCSIASSERKPTRVLWDHSAMWIQVW